MQIKIWMIVLIILIGMGIPFFSSLKSTYYGNKFDLRIWSAILTAAIGSFIMCFVFQMNDAEARNAEEVEISEEDEQTEEVEQVEKLSAMSYWYNAELYEKGNMDIISGVTCEASSTLGSSKYHSDKLLDGDDSTCWQEGADDYGIGESLKFNFETPSEIGYIRIVDGRADSETKFYQNGRVAALELYLPEKDESVELKLADTIEPQLFEIKGAKDITELMLTIKDVYTEQAIYKDTVVSEITFITDYHY